MTIRAISRQEFDRFVNAGGALALVSGHAVEWYSDDAGVVVGVIACDESEFDLMVLVLRRGQDGTFRSLGADVCIRDRDDARRLLLARMRTALTQKRSVLATRCPAVAAPRAGVSDALVGDEIN